jgi:GWxTD domain-containing protein
MKKIIAYTLIIAIVAACSSSRKVKNTTQNTSYKHDANALHPHFLVFNSSDTISELHFKIHSKELLYMRPDGLNFHCNALVAYRLYDNFDSKTILDSASVRVVDENNTGADKFLIGKINFHAKSGRKYFLRTTVTDLNKNTSATGVMEVIKNNDVDRQNFLVKTKADDAPLFGGYSTTNVPLVIQYKAKLAVNVYVRFYQRDFPLAAPPFSNIDEEPFKYKADSTFALQLSNDGTVDFTMKSKGFYHIQLDTSKRDGVTIYNFSETFPEIKKAEEMVPPLRFLTTRQEFEDLTNSKTPKASVEKFWINCTGNQEKARDAITRFYGRMQDANNYYTSYLEGWKTDRGMIYLIFGLPSTIIRTGTAETWTYGEETNMSSLQFTFTKVSNPFTDNDYLLERSLMYKQQWYSAVDIWRQGRIYLQD